MQQKLAIAITLTFALLATVYSVVTPIFEASDELTHFPVAEHIATTGALPVQDPTEQTLWKQEGSQPPLYYALSAAIVYWVDTSDLEQVHRLNPHAKVGIPNDADNKNMIIHGPHTAQWQGTVLAVHLVRFFSVALSTISVALSYQLAREVFDGARWLPLLAMVLVAFNPMFLFISGSVNNDNLIVLLATWVMLLSVRIVREGVTRRRALTLALVFALASITKVSGLTLAAFMGVALLAHGLQTGNWRESFLTGFAITGAWLVIALWWYIRNIALYGEITGTVMQVAVAGARPPISLFQLLREEWYGFWVAYWGWFGGVNVVAAGWVYAFFGVVSVIAVVGSVGWFVRRALRREWREMLLPGMLVMQLAIVMVALIRWTMMTYASQGRLIFPIIAAVSMLSALGLLHWLPERYRPAAVGTVALPALLIGAITPFAFIAPAYAQPPTVEALPPDATPLGTRWGPLELVGVRTEGVTRHAGDYLPITAYWRLTEPTDTDYTTTYTAFGRDDAVIGKVDSYPGGGMLPTSQMEPGVIIEDRYLIPLAEDLTAPTAAEVIVGVGRQAGGQFTVLEPDEGDVTLTLAGVLYPANLAECALPPTEGATPQATFGEFATLEAYPVTLTPGQPTDLRLVWDTHAPTATPMNVFVHLVDEGGTIVAQADGPPLGGDYPTHLWRVPCRVADAIALPIPTGLPPGSYRVLVGLYDPADPTFSRMPAVDPSGSPYPANAVPITEQSLP